jgi:hypothetical protein
MATITLPQELKPALPRRRPTHSTGQLVVFARAIAAIVAAATWPTTVKSTAEFADWANQELCRSTAMGGLPKFASNR